MKHVNRCSWAGDNPLYIAYHDREWGVPVYEDQKIFEFLVLESFQAGLSWITILNKRENFRKAFDNFDYKLIAKYDSSKFEKLILDKGIVRNKLKIQAAINNAKAFIKVQKEFGTFSKYIWSFVENQPIVNYWKSEKEVPARTAISNKISADMKRRGFKFVGSTILYAHMQATGMVNDHVTHCFRHAELQKEQP